MNFKCKLICAVFVVMFFITGCNRQTKVETEAASSFAKPVAGAHIQFEAMDCNLGYIGPETTHNCEFQLQNTGSEVLEISDVRIGQDCAHWEVTAPYRKSYAPGESGTLSIPYTAKKRLGAITEYVYLKTNDTDNPSPKLTVNAIVEDKIYYEPRHIRFSLDKPNAGSEDITLISMDGKEFSVKKVSSTGDILTTDMDPSAKADQFVLRTSTNLRNLRKTLKGRIRLITDHPKCESIVIPFEVLPEFKTVPAAITVVNTIPGVAITKRVKVLSSYGQAFTIESIKSQNNIVEVIEQKSISGGYAIKFKITPPPKPKGIGQKNLYKDVIILRTSDDREIKIKCTGLYRRKPA